MKDHHHNDTIAFKFNFWLGIRRILLGMSLNTWTLGQLLATDGTIDSTTGRSLIFAFETIFIGFGVYLVITRPAFSFANMLLIFVSSRLIEIYRLLLEDRFPFPTVQQEPLLDAYIPRKAHG